MLPPDAFVGVDEALSDTFAAGAVTTTVLPGATLVTTVGVAVVVEVSGGGGDAELAADEDEAIDGVELELELELPPTFDTESDVPVRYTDQ